MGRPRIGLSTTAGALLAAAAFVLIADARPATAAHRSPVLHAGSRLARTIDAPAGQLIVVAHVHRCPASVVVGVDGRRRARLVVRARRSRAYPLPVHLEAGRHRVTLSVRANRRCRPKLVLDGLRVRPRRVAGNPLAGARFYVDPSSNAARTEQAWRADGRTADADAIGKIARNSWAAWFGDWNGPDPGAAVREHVAGVRAAGAFPVLVAYDIPARDCGGYSAGGAATSDAYRHWIRGFAASLNGPAAVVLEPDAVPGLDCLGATDQASALALLRYAVDALAARPGVAVYIDAGHAGWHPPSVIASRLEQAGVARARGFSLNVSNFDTTASEADFGRAVSRLLGGKPFVIDTSRNGRGPAPGGAWCNPDGRGLGRPPTADTGDAAIDALLWVKVPGESDGSCNGGPPAGVWWPDYALGLAQRAAF